MRVVLFLAGFGFLLWTAATSLTQVNSSERGVIRRIGRILDETAGPGLHVGWPWGIDQVDRVTLAQRTITIRFDDKDTEEDAALPGQMLTGDHNLVDVQFSINYRVLAEEAGRYVLQKDHVEAFILRAALSLATEWIAARKIDDVMRGKNELRQHLRAGLNDRLKAFALGIRVEDAAIAKLDPPDQLREAFERVAQAERGVDIKVKQADQTANRQRLEAKATKDKLLREARTYASVERLKASTDADNFRRRLVQYQEFSARNPEYINTLWRDEMTRAYARMREDGRIELLDHFVAGGELTITQFPLQPRRK